MRFDQHSIYDAHSRSFGGLILLHILSSLVTFSPVSLDEFCCNFDRFPQPFLDGFSLLEIL